MLEVLIAALLFLVIMLGTLPLFTQSLTSNTSGALATKNASDVKDAIETTYQRSWDQVTTGTLTEVAVLGKTKWYTGSPPAGETLRATRTTTVREYHISALDDGVLETSEALAGADPFWVNIKEVEVNVLGEAEGALAATQDVTQRILRSQ